ncbi:MAG TPA: hypothetical protein VHR17_15260, partial [Thermoanaerobaculia bacterium]|nr:hypothetical protein [Thermoanaerobaculia bacterium]
MTARREAHRPSAGGAPADRSNRCPARDRPTPSGGRAPTSRCCFDYPAGCFLDLFDGSIVKVTASGGSRSESSGVVATETARVDPGAVEQLLATKLLVPALGPEVVPRPRLVEQLNEATRRRVTLVAAPAGFGKTTAVAGWIAATRPPVVWLTLDEGDNEPGRFLAHLVSAVRAHWADVGAHAAAQLVRAPLRGPAILGALLNDLAAQESPLTLVLDEFE